jgi:hypothetical protein
MPEQESVLAPDDSSAVQVSSDSSRGRAWLELHQLL